MIHPKIKKTELKAALLKAYVPTSYSKVEAYEKCPRAAFLRYVAKLFPALYDLRPGVKSDALIRGNLAHDRMEKWARLGFKAIGAPAEAKAFTKEVKARKLDKLKKVVVEEMWSYDDKLAPVVYKTPGEWFRIKCDLAFVDHKPAPLIVDHKTGKRYDSHRTQGRLYAAAFLAKYPEPDSVEVEFWYLDLGHIGAMTISRAEVSEIRDDFVARVKPMLNDLEHKPNPTRLCGWCEFSKDKGGPCEHG